MNPQPGPPSSLDDVEALLRDPAVHAEGRLLEKTVGCGRPRAYPPYMLIVYRALISTWGSARRVQAELAHPVVWRFMQAVVKEEFPDDRSKWLPDTPMRRHHHDYARRFFTDPTMQAKLAEVHRQHAVKLANEMGLLDPNGGGSFTHPDADRVVQSDGKVIEPLLTPQLGDTRVDKATGELIQKRYEPDASLHVVGDGHFAYGNKFVLTSTRSEHDRVILDVASVPDGTKGGEAAVAVDSFRRLAPLAPGIQAVAYDMALRGTHIDTIMRDFGWLVLAKVAAQSSGVKPRSRKRIGPYIPKSRRIEVRSLRRADGAEEDVPIYAEAGAAGIGRLTESGELAFIALKRIRTHRNSNKTGGFRWYNEYELPSEYEGNPLSLRLLGNDEDRKVGLNRTENLRAIPPSDPDFTRLFGRRNDTESINRAIDDTLYLRRAHSVGQAAQLADLFGFALLVNARTRARHRARERLKATAA
jgi:hypothetical protein